MDGKGLRPKTDKDFGAPPAGYVAGVGRGAAGFASGASRDRPTKLDDDKETDLGDSNYDSFAGYGGSLFKQSGLDKEDLEADAIYDMIDTRMESRKKKTRDQKAAEDLAKARSERPNVQAQFADYKKQLATISEEDWMNIPSECL